MQIFYLGDNLRGMTKHIFWIQVKKSIIYMLSAEFPKKKHVKCLTFRAIVTLVYTVCSGLSALIHTVNASPGLIFNLNGKQWRSWLNEAFFEVWPWPTLFAEAWLSEYIDEIWHVKYTVNRTLVTTTSFVPQKCCHYNEFVVVKNP